MAANQDLYEKILIEQLNQSDQSAFGTIFTKYYQDLVRFSIRFTRNPDAAEELVQDVFVKLWENRNSLVISTSLKSFLLKAVQNRSLDHLRFESIRNKYVSKTLETLILSDNETENQVLHSELEEHFLKVLANLPEPYVEVYRMSRNELMTYTEIAQKIGVSVRTVEVRMAKALHIIRLELKDFLVMVLYCLLLQ
jgi:RNA polymerase sigma-70 factor (ECF subfamily)